MSAEILARLERIEGLLREGGHRPPLQGPRTRVQKCTQGAFELLPAMVSRQEFMDWTGYSRAELREEIRSGAIKVYRPKGHVKARYYKAEIARLGGWRM